MAKVKVTISLDEEIVRELEVQRAEGGWRSRSDAIGRALAGWLEECRRAKLDLETEAYYRSLTDEERQEDAEWAAVAAESAGLTWDTGDR